MDVANEQQLVVSVCGRGVGRKGDSGFRGQQSTALRVSQSVTSVPGASEGHRSGLQGGTPFLLRGLMGKDKGGGRARLSGALSNSWGGKREVQKAVMNCGIKAQQRLNDQNNCL